MHACNQMPCHLFLQEKQKAPSLPFKHFVITTSYGQVRARAPLCCQQADCVFRYDVMLWITWCPGASKGTQMCMGARPPINHMGSCCLITAPDTTKI